MKWISVIPFLLVEVHVIHLKQLVSSDDLDRETEKEVSEFMNAYDNPKDNLLHSKDAVSPDKLNVSDNELLAYATVLNSE